MNTARLRAFRQLEFKNPEHYLQLLRPVRSLAAQSNLHDRVKSLRTRPLRVHKDRREAALFCYGLRAVTGNQTLEFAVSESSDYDAVFRCVENRKLCFTPIQLKEVVPAELDPQATLEREIGKLEKYADSEDLVVGIFLNQRGRFELTRFIAPKVKVSEIWIFGCCAPDESKWYVWGDVLTEPKFFEFDYPR